MDFRLSTSSKITQNFSPCCGTFSPAPLSHSPAAKSLTPCDVSEPRPPRQMVRVMFCAMPHATADVLPITLHLIPHCPAALHHRSCSRLPVVSGVKAEAVQLHTEHSEVV